MRGVGDDRLVDPQVLPAQRHAPGERAAPVMADNAETADPQRIGQQEDIADQLVRRVGLHRLRLRRAAIAALVGRDAAKAVGEMRDLVAPGAVAFGKSVEENQHRRIDRAFVHHVEVNAIVQRHPLEIELAHSAASSFSI